jgi:4-oxalomesaconate hydratase
MSGTQKSGLVVTAHPGDFVWRAGGAIALHAKLGYRVKIVCLSYGERGESQFAWKQAGMTLETSRQAAAPRPSRRRMLGAEIEFFDAGDYPLHITERHAGPADRHLPRAEPLLRADPRARDPYNVDHPEAARFAQEARIVAQAAGHKPAPAASPIPRHRSSCSSRTSPSNAISSPTVHPQHRRGLGAEAKAFEILAAQKHLWDYYERVALNRGMQGGRNSGKAMTYGEAYQTSSRCGGGAGMKPVVVRNTRAPTPTSTVGPSASPPRMRPMAARRLMKTYMRPVWPGASSSPAAP